MPVSELDAFNAGLPASTMNFQTLRDALAQPFTQELLDARTSDIEPKTSLILLPNSRLEFDGVGHRVPEVGIRILEGLLKLPEAVYVHAQFVNALAYVHGVRPARVAAQFNSLRGDRHAIYGPTGKRLVHSEVMTNTYNRTCLYLLGGLAVQDRRM